MDESNAASVESLIDKIPDNTMIILNRDGVHFFTYERIEFDGENFLGYAYNEIYDKDFKIALEKFLNLA